MPETTENINETGGIPEVTLTAEVSEMTRYPVDATLSLADAAADAKATGDAIANVAADLADMWESVEEAQVSAASAANRTGEDIPISSENDETLSAAITALQGWTGEDIPVNTDTEAQTIAEAVEALRGRTATDIPMTDGGDSVKEAVEELQARTGADIAVSSSDSRTVADVIAGIPGGYVATTAQTLTNAQRLQAMRNLGARIGTVIIRAVSNTNNFYINDSSITANTMCWFPDLDTSGMRSGFTWSTTAGTLTITVTALPENDVTLTVVMMEVGT